MTYLDKLLEFDSNVAITVTRVSDNVLDGQQNRDLGSGDHVLDVFCVVGTAFTAGGSATLQVQVQGAPDDGTGSPGTYVTLAETPVIAVANLTAGQGIARMPLPLRNPANGATVVTTPPRFYRLNYIVATGPMLTGTIKAWMIDHNGRQDNYQYPSGFTATN